MKLQPIFDSKGLHRCSYSSEGLLVRDGQAKDAPADGWMNGKKERLTDK
jgi:hypothetical protein